ncbi:toprim domain-containing protein [Brevibacillus brevis]|uniref:toprim domain-containing protein n=1 Tax=Brevibacillus brevis TaxID=1393 RepID=UPI0022AACC37|nr:toprim domain-containing protein [Brevibacillus brevis]
MAEKPSAARAIADTIVKQYQKLEGFYQNDDKYAVTWAVGHLIGLANPEEYAPKYTKWDLNSLPIVPNPIKLSTNPKTKKQPNVIRKLASYCVGIVNATDCARESELIFGYIMEYLGTTSQLNDYGRALSLRTRTSNQEYRKKKPMLGSFS